MSKAYGECISTREVAPVSQQRSTASATASRCVMPIPLGTPVDPEVYMM